MFQFLVVMVLVESYYGFNQRNKCKKDKDINVFEKRQFNSLYLLAF